MVNHVIVNRLSKSCLGAARPREGRKRDTMAAKDSDAKHEQLTAQTQAPRMRDLETIDAELQLVVAFRRAARERGGPLPSKPWRTRCWMNTAS